MTTNATEDRYGPGLQELGAKPAAADKRAASQFEAFMQRRARYIGEVVGAVVAVQLLACEPYCPKGYDKRGDTCYRIRDSGVEEDLSDAEAASEVADDGGEPPSMDSAVGADNSHADGAINDGWQSCADAAIGGDCGAHETTAVCGPSPCEHGGVCFGTPDGASCDCTGTGYTGDKCEVDSFDECSGPNVCSAAVYPCVQTEAPGCTCQGQLADWPMPDATPGAKVKPSYDITTDPELVIDEVTGLVWQRYLPQTYRGCTGGSDVAGSACSWQEAKDYCAALVLGDQDDWRLPTRIELDSIVDDTHPLNGALDPLAFPAGSQGDVWSASPRVSTSGEPAAFILSLGITTLSMPVGKALGVRCVRRERVSSGTPGGRYELDASPPGSVTDARTGLRWLRTVDLQSHTWTAAVAFCSGLGVGWRVPTKKELLTLVDASLPVPSGNGTIDFRVFPSAQGAVRLWTATTWQAGSGDGFARVIVDTEYGSPGRSPSDTDPAHVRCVR